MAALCDFSVNFLTQTDWAAGEEFEPESGHVRESTQLNSEERATYPSDP